MGGSMSDPITLEAHLRSDGRKGIRNVLLVISKFGFTNINDSAEIIELIACGAHAVLFSTGRGSVVDSIISPVIKLCSNPHTYAVMEGDMDLNAGRVISGDATLDELGDETVELLLEVVKGAKTKSESLGHREAVLTYKGETVSAVTACNYY